MVDTITITIGVFCKHLNANSCRTTRKQNCATPATTCINNIISYRFRKNKSTSSVAKSSQMPRTAPVSYVPTADLLLMSSGRAREDAFSMPVTCGPVLFCTRAARRFPCEHHHAAPYVFPGRDPHVRERDIIIPAHHTWHARDFVLTFSCENKMST